jgi:hypothetical protein
MHMVKVRAILVHPCLSIGAQEKESQFAYWKAAAHSLHETCMELDSEFDLNHISLLHHVIPCVVNVKAMEATNLLACRRPLFRRTKPLESMPQHFKH